MRRLALVLLFLLSLPLAALGQAELPEHVYQTLVEVCRSYPYPVVQSDAHLGEILNAVAWRHRDEGWGLSRKTGGKRVSSPVGEVAEDILQLPNGSHYDVLGSAAVGNRLQPGRGRNIGTINLRDRPWVAPVAHTPSWLNVDNPPPVVVSPPPAPGLDLSAVLARLEAIDARLASLEARPLAEPAPPDLGALEAFVDDMVGRGPGDDPAVVPNHVTDLKLRLDALRVTLEQFVAWLRGRAVLRY